MNECLACGNTSLRSSVIDYLIVKNVSVFTTCGNIYDCGLILEDIGDGQVRYKFFDKMVEVPRGVLLVFDKEVF